jgi:hypothetical protein
MLLDCRDKGTKRPEVGGGVEVQLGDTKYRVTAEILEIDDSDGTLRVKANGKEAWIYGHEVLDVLAPGDYALDRALNELDTQK